VKAHSDPLFQIVQVNLQSDRGGDGRIVSGLHERYKALGYPAFLLVGRGSVTGASESLLPNDEYRSRWARAWLARAQRRRAQGLPRSQFARFSSWIAEPSRRLRIRNGFEDFRFPATLPEISQLIRKDPSILHLHNLHGGYFDLRALPTISDLAPIVLTLHDQWIFTGHCAHSFECDRWTSGCGNCPDLTIYPGIPKDRTRENFILKQQLLSRTRLYLAAPSKWLMDKAQRSLLAPAIEEARIIPNGVDTSVFRPGDRAIERFGLGLPHESRILLCAGEAARSNHWTDQRLLRSTLHYLAQDSAADCTLLVLGSERNFEERIEGIEVIHRQYERDASRVAGYYRASDLYLHPARADTFPTAVLESLACATPVVATDIGGIPEQVKSLWASTNSPVYPPSLASGILVNAEDSTGLGRAIDLLLLQEDLRRRLGRNGSDAAVLEFSIIRQVERYLDWYRQILTQRGSTDRSAAQDIASRTRGLRQ
jgi:glycosyltransferase involved in cell wall biosynthesis